MSRHQAPVSWLSASQIVRSSLLLPSLATSLVANRQCADTVGGRKSHGQHTSINRIIKQHKNLTYFPLSHFGCASISSTYPSQSVRPSYVTHSDFNRTMRVTVVTVSLIQEVAKNAPSDQPVPVGGILLMSGLFQKFSPASYR